MERCCAGWTRSESTNFDGFGSDRIYVGGFGPDDAGVRVGVDGFGPDDAGIGVGLNRVGPDPIDIDRCVGSPNAVDGIRGG